MKEQPKNKFETVMVIDDNIVDLYIASRMITKNNFGKNVLMYTNAKEALQFLTENQFDTTALPQIIFIDIYMPCMSGFKFLSAYNELSESLKSNCKAFIISSTIDDFDIIRAKSDVNIATFQVKPITKEFLDRIN